jgi:hypothetical protein
MIAPSSVFIPYAPRHSDEQSAWRMAVRDAITGSRPFLHAAVLFVTADSHRSRKKNTRGTFDNVR